MKTGIVKDQNLEKQMGCMAGFLQIFDRHQILTGKRIYSTKRLPPSAAVNSSPEPETPSESTGVSQELERHQLKSTPSPERSKLHTPIELRSPLPETRTPSETPAKMPLPLPVFEFKEGTKSSWKFSKEAPRLSLDSRAIVDAKGSLHPREIRTNRAILSTNRCTNAVEGTESDTDNQRRSPSVIARLMGLEQLPNSDPEPVKKVELRRSVSESRASRDLFQYRFFDSNNFQLKQIYQQGPNSQSNAIRDINSSAMENRICNGRPVDPREFSVRNVRAEPAKANQRGVRQKKSFYDSADFFPEPKQTVSIYGEIEKRLKMRGIDESSNDLETLKQILEALQLKGLLHSKKHTSQINQRNFVPDGRSNPLNESPIVLMKPSRSPASCNRSGRTRGDSPPTSFRSSPRARRNINLGNESLPTVSPRRERSEILDRNVRNQTRGRSSSSPTRSENSVKSPNRRRPMSIDTPRKVNDSVEHRRISPVQSPKVSSRRIVLEQQVANRSPRMRKPTAEIYYKEEKVFAPAEDESSTISESSISTCSQTDIDHRLKAEEYNEGRNLLERCDKLLHSIAEITTTELQPSPVSVLDSSFYKDESSSPSPVLKRSIDYKDQAVQSEDDNWSLAMSSIEAKSEEMSEDCDYIYVSEILRASNFLPQDDSDLFLLLEKQQYLKGKETCKGSRLERRLIFDTINEILNRNRQLPPWKAVSMGGGQTSLIWSEFQRIRERDESEDLLEVICGVLRKDLADDAIHGWGNCPIEMGDAVLDIERLIFKDLIGETIGDLAAFGGQFNNKVSALRRKLVF